MQAPLPAVFMLRLVKVTVADRTCRHWFKRFQEDDISLEDYPRSRRPLQCDVERLQALIGDNPQLTTGEISIVLDCNCSTIDSQLHQLGKVNRLGSRVLHQLTQQRIDHLQLFVVKTQPIQVSPTNRY